MRTAITKRVSLILAVSALIFFMGCSGGNQPDPGSSNPPADQNQPPRVTLDTLYGCQDSGIAQEVQDWSLEVSFSSLPATGQFVSLGFPEGICVIPASLEWDTPDETPPVVLALAEPICNGLEVGVVPLVGYDGGQITVSCSLESIPGEQNTPDSEVSASAHGLEAYDIGSGQVKLNWTEDQPGDFDFNGLVNSADLIPLAEHYGETIDRELADAPLLHAYWLDSDADGTVTAADAAVISENWQDEVAGFLVRIVDESADHGPDPQLISREQASEQTDSPPRYSLAVAGIAEDTWEVVATNSTGGEGTAAIASCPAVDLIARITVEGIDLNDLVGINPKARGDAPAKTGTRVIEPIDIVDRIPIAEPVTAVGDEYRYIALPRERELMLEVNYQPVVNLATGHQIEPALGLDEPIDFAKLAATAVPFKLPAAAGAVEIDVDILVSPNPFGGYFVELIAFVTEPGGLPELSHTLLSYQDGRLKSDTDEDEDFSDEWEFLDTNRDNISDSYIQEYIDFSNYGVAFAGSFFATATVRSINPAMWTITLADIELIDSSELLPGDTHEMLFNEFTIFATELGPYSLEPGQAVNIGFTYMFDPYSLRPDVFWLDFIALSEPWA
jgi:hypothetical protein